MPTSPKQPPPIKPQAKPAPPAQKKPPITSFPPPKAIKPTVKLTPSNKAKKETKSRVPYAVFLGLVISATAFFIAFITTQKASTIYKYQNLKLVAPTPPTRIGIPPLLKPSVEPEAVEEFTPSIEFTAPPEATPATASPLLTEPL